MDSAKWWTGGHRARLSTDSGMLLPRYWCCIAIVDKQHAYPQAQRNPRQPCLLVDKKTNPGADLMRRFTSFLLAAALGLPLAPAWAQTMTTSALHQAAAANDSASIRQLLQDSKALDARDAQGRTALLVATHGNHTEAAKALIDAGANVNAKDDIQDSPYLYAGARGHQQILLMTLAHGADLRSTNRYGGTALIPAAERGHVETVRTLIGAGVDVNHVNRLGWTALLEAIILSDGGPCHQQIVQLLIDAKADVNLADKDGVSPLAHAKQRGYSAMVAMLSKAGAR